MLTFDAMVDALDDLRNDSGTRGKTFDQVLNVMIRAHVKDDQIRDEIRSEVYDNLARYFCAGVPSVELAPQIAKMVEHKVKSHYRNLSKTVKRLEYGVEVLEQRPASGPGVEERYEAMEKYEAVLAGLAQLRDSEKDADRRYFAVIDAARRGESPRQRLHRDFGEELSDDAAAHVLKRGRDKLKQLCGIPKDGKAL